MSAVGKTYFGKTAVQIDGARAWDKQNATQAWNDGGEVQQLMDAASSKMRQIVAQQAVGAVREFSESAEVGVRAEGNEILIGLRMTSPDAALIVNIPLRELLEKALKDIRPQLGQNQQAQNTLSAILSLSRQVVSLAQPGGPLAPVVPQFGVGHNSEAEPGASLSPAAPPVSTPAKPGRRTRKAS